MARRRVRAFEHPHAPRRPGPGSRLNGTSVSGGLLIVLLRGPVDPYVTDE